MSLNAQLTERQKEVVQRLAEEENIKGIAFDLKVSPKAIENRVALAKKKVGCFSLIGLVRFAFETGLVKLQMKS